MSNEVSSSSEASLEAAWQKLCADWENDAQHRCFVGAAAAQEQLPEAAKRYRAALVEPMRKVRAQQGIDRILALAMQSLTPPPREETRRSSAMGVAMAVLVVTLFGTVALARATGFLALLSPVVILGEVVLVALIPWRRFVRSA